MVHYKLTYFLSRGSGEPARLLLKYANIPFEDVRLDYDEWLKVKDNTPFGQIPTLEVDDVVIAQSFAIFRFCGKLAKLYPSDFVEAAFVDSIADYIREIDDKGFHDYFGVKCGFVVGDCDKFMEEQFKPMIKTSFPVITKWLNEAGNGYLTKSGLSWADIFAAEKIGNVINYDDKVASEWPEITAFVKRVYSLPSIKEYVDSRPQRLY